MNEGLQVVFLLGMVAGAYVFAHVVVEWVQRRFLLVTGIEYILLGVVLGPEVFPGIRALADLQSLAPIIAFAAGWVGLIYGMELDLTKVREQTQGKSVRLAAFDVAVTGGLVGWVSYEVLARGWLLEGVSPAEATVAAWALGVSAAAGSSQAVDLVRGRYRALETELLPLLSRTARLSDVAAICGFGLLLCVYHVNMESSGALTAIWLVWSVVLGAGLAVLFSVFLGDTTDGNHLFLALTGILIFASGAAFFLKLSALLVNLILGVVIVSFTRHGKGVHETLERSRAPVRLILLVFAGALWKPVAFGPGVAVVLGYVVLRAVSKFLGGFLATVGTPLRSDVYRGMMAQGDVAIAIAIGMRLVYDGPVIDIAYTAILVAVVLHELVGPRLLKGLLVDAGELRQDIDGLQPAPMTEAS